MAKLMSAADQRGLDWMMEWSALGNGLTSDPDTGNLLISHDGDEKSQSLAAQIRDDALLRHAVGRVFLDYLRWDYANNPPGVPG